MNIHFFKDCMTIILVNLYYLLVIVNIDHEG